MMCTGVTAYVHVMGFGQVDNVCSGCDRSVCTGCDDSVCAGCDTVCTSAVACVQVVPSEATSTSWTSSWPTSVT